VRVQSRFGACTLSLAPGRRAEAERGARGGIVVVASIAFQEGSIQRAARLPASAGAAIMPQTACVLADPPFAAGTSGPTATLRARSPRWDDARTARVGDRCGHARRDERLAPA
jgi:hypothetical protein